MPANFENGIFGSGQPAWHGAGTVLDADYLTWEQVVTAVPEIGMPVHKQPVYIIGTDGRPHKASDWVGMLREDGAILGVNGASYEPVQNAEAFGFLSELLGRGEAIANTAGTLEGGRKAFICCLAPDSFYVGGEKSEEHRGFLCFVNSFDGSAKVGCLVGATRIVCSNTYNAAISGAQTSYWFRHTKNVSESLGEARQALQTGASYWGELKRLGDAAIRQSFSDRQFTSVLDATIPLPTAAGRRLDNAERDRQQLRSLFVDGADVQNIRGTAWAAVNAFTAFSDHSIGSRETTKSSAAENRMKRIIFDASLKTKAAAMIYEMAEVR